MGANLKNRNEYQAETDKQLNKLKQESMINKSLIDINSAYTEEAMYGIPGQHTFSPLDKSIAETESQVRAANDSAQFTAAKRSKERANLDSLYGTGALPADLAAQYPNSNPMHYEVGINPNLSDGMHSLNPNSADYILNNMAFLDVPNFGGWGTYNQPLTSEQFSTGTTETIGTANMDAILGATNTFNDLYNSFGAGYQNLGAQANLDFANAYDSWVSSQYDIFSMITGGGF